MSREEAIACVVDSIPKEAIVVATTGRAVRELYAVREFRAEGHENDFHNVGAMGHASQIALGVALSRPDRLVVCLDGDAAIIMHMGTLAINGTTSPSNLLHVVLNNGAHESVGGQSSAARSINLTNIAHSCGYATVGNPVATLEQIVNAVRKLIASDKPGFLDVLIRQGIRSDLGPLAVTPADTRARFLQGGRQ